MIDFYITEQSIRFSSPVIAANSLSFLEAKFHFSADTWTDYSKWAHFRQGDTVYDLNLENDMIRAEMGLDLSLGAWEVYVTGIKGESRLTTVPVILTVKESGLIDEPLHKIPLSVAEQVDSKASLALQKAAALEQDAADGRFDGKSFVILGFFDSEEELFEAAGEYSGGEIYCVGQEAPYDMYIYDALSERWVNSGPVSVKGEKGDKGASFTPVPDGNGNLNWTNDAGLQNPPTINIMGPKGDKGDAGKDGKSPYEIAAEEGFQGTLETFNWSLKNIASHAAAHCTGGTDMISVSTAMLAEEAVTAAKLADGAVTAEKLAANAVSSYYTGTISTGWSGSAAPYTNTLTVDGLTTDDHPIIWLNASNTYSTAASEANQWKWVYKASVSADNTLTFYASSKPTVALPVQMLAVRK